MSDQSDLVADVLGEFVELGPPTTQALELGEAVRHHVTSRPAVSRSIPDAGVVATLLGRGDTCPMCGHIIEGDDP